MVASAGDTIHLAIDGVGIRGGGGATILGELLFWLPRIRPHWTFDVFLLPPKLRDFPDPTANQNFSVHHVRLGNSGVGRLSWQNFCLPAVLKRGGADVLLCFANVGLLKPPVPQVVFFQQMLALDKPALARRSYLAATKKRIQFSCARRSFHSSSRIIVQTRVMRQLIASSDPSLEFRTSVVASGIREVNINPVRPNITSLLGTLAPPRILYVADCHEHKNHNPLIHALHRVVVDYPSAALLLTADPSNPRTRAEGSMIKRLTSTVEDLGLEKHVYWIGKLTPPEVDLALGTCDIAVFPSLSESFGLPLVEAMAKGCPLAVANLPYAREVSEDAALYFEPDDPSDIANAILKIIRHTETAQSLRQRGKRRSQLFSCQAMSNQFAMVLEDAVNEIRTGDPGADSTSFAEMRETTFQQQDS